jgi:hypothetical protein
LIVLAAALGIAVAISSNQAKANSVLLNTGEATSLSYSIGYLDGTAPSPLPPFPPSPTITVPAVTVTTPPSPWLANGPNSNWIGPNATGTAAGTLLTGGDFQPGFNATTSAPQGFYYYTTTFSLSGGPPYFLSGGLWTSDNQGVNIYLNGHSEGQTNGGAFNAFIPFTLNNADFVTGTNTLIFTVFNEQFPPPHASPTGLRVEGLVTSVPEPAAIAVMASGLPILAGFFVVRRRRRAV